MKILTTIITGLGGLMFAILTKPAEQLFQWSSGSLISNPIDDVDEITTKGQIQWWLGTMSLMLIVLMALIPMFKKGYMSKMKRKFKR
jgi:hypothetical protein